MKNFVLLAVAYISLVFAIQVNSKILSGNYRPVEYDELRSNEEFSYWFDSNLQKRWEWANQRSFELNEGRHNQKSKRNKSPISYKGYKLDYSVETFKTFVSEIFKLKFFFWK